MNNSIWMESLRHNNPYLSNIYIFCINTGVLLGQGANGPTSGMNAVNFGCDACMYSVHATAAASSFFGSHLIHAGVDPRYYAPFPGGSAYQFDSSGDLRLDQADISNVAKSAVRFLPAGNLTPYQNYRGTGVVLTGWAEDGGAEPGIDMPPGSYASHGQAQFKSSVLSSPTSGPQVSCGVRIDPMVLNALTTTNSPNATLVTGLDREVPKAWNQVMLPLNCGVIAEIITSGRDVVNGSMWAAQHYATVTRATGAPALVGPVSYTPLGQTSGFSVGDGVTLDSTNNALSIAVTQNANANNVIWRAAVKLTMVPNQ